MDKVKKVLLKSVLLSFVIAYISTSGNKVSVSWSAVNTLDINLSNTELISSVKFNIIAPEGVKIEDIQRGFRTMDESWIVAKYFPDDSKLTVLIQNIDQKPISVGEGCIVKIMFAAQFSPEKTMWKLEDIILSDMSSNNVNAVNMTLSADKLFERLNPTTYSMNPNYPNPFNPATNFEYSLADKGFVSLIVYDMLGREIAIIKNEAQDYGTYKITFDASKLSSGSYIAQMKVRDSNGKLVFNKTQKLLLTK